MDWKPIVLSDRSMAENCWESIRAIAVDVLTRSYPPTSNLPLKYHSSYEEALLFAYLARGTSEPEWNRRCVDRLNEVIEQSHGRMASFSLFGGLSGLGWTVEHVCRVLEEAYDGGAICSEAASDNTPEEDLNEQVDAALVNRLLMPVQRGRFDLIHGLAGYGVYFLERWPRGRSTEGLSLVIGALERIADEVGSGTTWYSTAETIAPSDKELCPAGYYNLGVAHGVPGVIQFLYQVTKTGIEPTRVTGLLERALIWLLAQADSTNPDGIRFRSWLTPDGSSRSVRPAWCYGDLGIAAVLFQVGHGIGNATLKTFASDMFDNCLKLPIQRYRVQDAGLCHGATGVAHIYNRMYQIEGDYRFRNAALEWYERALSMFKPGIGVGGYFKRVTVDGQGAWEPWPGLLDGSIGVALALLAAVTSVEPQWDRELLLSSRSFKPEQLPMNQHSSASREPELLCRDQSSK